jgi:serine/threonine-protein kinase
MNYNTHLPSEVAGYRLTSHIGSGGMGDVYKAFNPELRRTAAIKILHQKEYADRFRNEAYIQSSVTHPNITRLYESVLNTDKPCIIMEYVEGINLDELIKQKGRLSNEETENIILQVANALAYLHQKDILHRDIKPSNFKLQADGIVKMLDFGIAKHKYSPRFTQQGFLVGTTEYMAPEQFEQQVEQKSDIWSLGVMTYEMLTGYMPFEASNPVTLRYSISKARFTDPKLLVPAISEKLKTLIDQTLRINPAQRITAAQVCAQLQSASSKKNQLRIFPTVNNKLTVQAIRFFNSNVFRISTALLICITIILVAINKPLVPENKDKPDIDKELPITGTAIKINVPSVENALLVFPDGKQLLAPSEIKGNDGELIEFTVRANGYSEKKIVVEINNRRRNYDITLEKINP